MMIAMRAYMTQAGRTKWAANSLRAAFCAAFVLSLASCSRLIDDNRVAFGGIYFSSKVQSEKAHKENFEIFVRKATQNITAAREAGNMRPQFIAYATLVHRMSIGFMALMTLHHSLTMMRCI